MVETHGRAETEALLGGLPQQPLVRSEYRGVMLEEMDLDGLLAAKPKLVLVDELAHTNAPGSRHAKRWQDIQELLAAGIDVYTTVNVQHLESLNDQVRGITGVQVRETLPDWVLQEAYELLLIDLPPRELLERLRDGKVYVPEQARAAIDAFFTQTNLTALRELAMQTAAAQVDNDLAQGYRQLGQAAPAVRGRLLVGVDGDAQAERLVRHASRVAQRRHLPWSLVHVDNGSVRDEQSRLRLQSAQQLAERLGGEVVLLRAGEVAKTLIQHAAERRASLVLVGQSRPRLRRRLFGGGLAARLLRDARGLEINVLDSDHEQDPATPAFGAVAGVVRLCAGAWSRRCWPVRWPGRVASVLPLPNISLVFLAAVLLVAVRSSLGPALACAALSFLTYDFLFIPPNFSFSIQREEDVLTLLFFLLMAALTGNLAARQRRQLQALRDTQEETTELLDLSRKLTAATDRQAVVSAAAQHLERLERSATVPAQSRRPERLESRNRWPAGVYRSRTRRRRLGLATRSTGGRGHRHVAVRALVVVAVVGGRRAAGAARRLCQRRPDLERPASAFADRVESAAGPGAGPRATGRRPGSGAAARRNRATAQRLAGVGVPRFAHAADLHARQHRQPVGPRRSDPAGGSPRTARRHPR